MPEMPFANRLAAHGMQGLMQLVDLQHTHQHTVSIATL